MDNARKNLKYMSIAILVLAVVTLARVLLEVFSIDFDAATLPEGATPELVLAAQIGLCIFSLILLLPQVFVGIKGMKIAKTPDSSKGHITWAIILAVLSAVCVISPVSNIIQTGDVEANWSELLDVLTDVAVYMAYIQYAIQVRKSIS